MRKYIGKNWCLQIKCRQLKEFSLLSIYHLVSASGTYNDFWCKQNIVNLSPYISNWRILKLNVNYSLTIKNLSRNLPKIITTICRTRWCPLGVDKPNIRVINNTENLLIHNRVIGTVPIFGQCTLLKAVVGNANWLLYEFERILCWRLFKLWI